MRTAIVACTGAGTNGSAAVPAPGLVEVQASAARIAQREVRLALPPGRS